MSLRTSDTEQEPIFRALGREDELLLRCARSRTTDANTERIGKLLLEEVDWKCFLTNAAAHGVLAVVAWSLQSHHRRLVPEQVQEHLLSVAASTASGYEQMTSGLLDILRALKREGLEPVVLKGPPFSHMVFADPAARACRDLDLLLAADHLRNAGEILVANGFAPHHHGERQGKPARFRQHAIPTLFLRQADRLLVDLHSELGKRRLGGRRMNTSLYDLCPSTSLKNGESVRVPPTHDMLLYLCSHGIQHGWRGIRFVSDLHEFIEGSPGINWAGLRQQANAECRARFLKQGLLISHRLMETPIPTAELAWASSDPKADALARQAVRHLLDLIRDRGNAPLARSSEFRSLEGIRDRLTWIAYVAKDVVTPCDLDESVVRLPRPLAPLYYLIRAGRLTAERLRRTRAVPGNGQQNSGNR